MGKFKTFIDLNDRGRLYFVLDVGRRSKMAMCVSEGKLVVRVPDGCPKKMIEEFILKNLDWIDLNLKRSMERTGLPKTYENGEKIKLLGEELILSCCESNKYKPPEIKDEKLVIYVNRGFLKEYVKNQTDKFIISIAEKKIKSAMTKMIAVTGLEPAKITIKNMSASWGRCISNGHISLNFKLVTQPEEYIEYVCLHELCHLVYMNHSRDFWTLVEKYCPDWRYIREKMKE